MNKLATMIPLLIGDKEVGRTALNKLVFFADVAHFLQHGKPISDTPHMKLTHGPVPQGITEVRFDLIRKGLLRETEREDRFFRQFSYSVPEGVDLAGMREGLEPSERQAIDIVRERLAGRTANYLSSHSHRFEPWNSSKPGFEMDLTRTREDKALRRWLTDEGILQ
ncbi:MAG: DUF4065 domain-containing protein [Rhodocyclaceae bacterium]|nr:DUF4065 domain-containing protein [Rhodocyclaceae bacterium]